MAAAATPPPAPAATPAAPPTPAPAPAPAPSPSPAPAAPAGGEGDPGSFDKFDTAFQDLDAPETPPAPPAAPPTPPKGSAAPKGTPAPAKPGAKPAAPAPPQGEFEEVEGVQVPRFKKDNEFRGWGLAGHKKAKQLEGELAQLRTQYQQIEQEHPKTKQERDALAARLAEIEKQHNETVEQIKYLSYERSSEYKDKYETPYRKAVDTAYSDVKELTVTEPDPTQPPNQDGSQPTRERPATPADFDEIYQLPLGPASKLAAKKFGAESVATVIQHRNNIRTLAKAANEALADWKNKAKDREKSENDQRTIEESQIQDTWKSINKQMGEDSRGADFWGEVKDDKEINDALAHGFAYADRRFSGEFKKLSRMEQMVLDASIRHRVAGFYRMKVELARIKAEHAQALKDLAELRGSGPGEPGTPGGGETPSTEGDGPMAEFDRKL